nr:DNA polymerase I [Spelaeicoccus albus]
MLIDGHSLAYRAFYALPTDNFRTATGQYTNAVYGFTSMLINVLGAEAPTHVAVAFDVSRESFRQTEYAEYKAGRAKTPPEFAGQVDLVQEVLEAMNISVVTKDGYEADDVLATMATQAAEAGLSVLVMSGDRDCLQLSNDKITVLYPKKGVSEMARMTPDAIEDKYGVSPENYRGLAALVGESADNLPGVPGVGPKTAAKWIAKYEGLDGVIAHIDEIGGKVGESLRENINNVLRNQRLNKLLTDVVLPVEIADTERRAPSREAVHQLFDALEFRVLRDRLFADSGPDESTAEAFTVETERHGPDGLAAWLQGIGTPAGLAVSGTWRHGSGDIDLLAIAPAAGTVDADAGNEQPRVGVIDPSALDTEAENALANWLADADVPKVMHDAKGPSQALAARGLPLRGLTCDTELAAYLLHPDQRTYKLDDLVMRYLGRTIEIDESDDGQLSLDLDGDAAADTALGSNAAGVRDLAKALDGELEKIGAAGLLTDLELPIQRVLAGMETAGIAVDSDRIARLEDMFSDAAERAADAAYETIGRQVNLGSPKQLQVVLFDELDMPKTKRTKTGYTTDADALTDLFAKTEHPFLAHLLDYRDNIRLKQTVEGLRKAVSDDGRVHTSYQQTVAATGRLSSTDPNLQNIPVRTTAGRQIREVFVVGKDSGGRAYESLLTADYSQIEMRIMAHLSGDDGLQAAFRAGEDLHNFVGARVFHVDEADVSAEMRSKVKAMSYGLAYGLSAFGLSRQLKISVDEAGGLRDEYFARFGGVRDYLQDVVEQARRTGYTETIKGRRRYLPDLTSSNRQRRDMAERAALNAPIQGSAADIMKLAMLGVDEGLRHGELGSRMLLQVHDEVIIEVASGEADAVEELVRDKMANAYSLDVPLDVNVGHGKSWHEAAH